jgi:hypothetical protein
MAFARELDLMLEKIHEESIAAWLVCIRVPIPDFWSDHPTLVSQAFKLR